jgi:rhodanese-related sulfurtransferase
MLFKRKHTMDVAEALAGQQAGRLVLVDVRDDAERARGFAPGSRHLPLGQLKQRLGELPADRPVAFICHSGRRSAMAAAAARRAGLDAHNVSGGMIAWQRQGLTTTTSGRTR